MHQFLSLGSIYILAFIVVISVVVFVHEYGHYWMARHQGIRVVTFSIGFGRPLFGWMDRHGTRWQVGWLPLGGYVKMFGDADAASMRPDGGTKKMTAAEKKVSFYHQSIGTKMAVVVAGPLANYIFAILVLALMFMISGQPFTPARITDVVRGDAGYVAGMRAGDLVTAIDGKAIMRFEDIRNAVSLNTGTPMKFEVMRGKQKLALTVTPKIKAMKDRFGGDYKVGMIGVVSKDIEYKKQTPIVAVGQAGKEVWDLSANTLKAVGQMIMGHRGAEDLGGPLRIAELSGKIAQTGILPLIWFMAMISVNLGLINLFPVPLLDGGHLVFYGLEAVRGKPLSARAMENALRLGASLVLALMVVATWNDLVHLKVVAYIQNLLVR